MPGFSRRHVPLDGQGRPRPQNPSPSAESGNQAAVDAMKDTFVAHRDPYGDVTGRPGYYCYESDGALKAMMAQTGASVAPEVGCYGRMETPKASVAPTNTPKQSTPTITAPVPDTPKKKAPQATTTPGPTPEQEFPLPEYVPSPTKWESFEGERETGMFGCTRSKAPQYLHMDGTPVDPGAFATMGLRDQSTPPRLHSVPVDTEFEKKEHWIITFERRDTNPPSTLQLIRVDHRVFCEDDKKRELDKRLDRKDIPLYVDSPFGSSVDFMNGRPPAPSRASGLQPLTKTVTSVGKGLRKNDEAEARQE